MNIIKPSFQIIDEINPEKVLEKIERCGRVCYKSEDRITEDSARKLVKNIIKSGHESVIEHVSITVKFIHNRGFSHELVRHRLAAVSQESTRYCNYSKDKFNNEITFIEPYWYDDTYDSIRTMWILLMKNGIEENYKFSIEKGLKPQEARGILPNDLKTEIMFTANLREWRHIFKVRCSKAAHPDMQRIMIPLRDKLIKLLPEVFEDLK
jgi:thymidylate synthase (FAD)